MGTWTPANLGSYPTLWLRADDADSINIVSGASLDYWYDTNGQDICASTNVSDYYPSYVADSLNQLPGIVFGESDSLQITNLSRSNFYPLGHPANYTIFVVARKSSPQNYNLYGVGADTTKYKWGTVDYSASYPNALYWYRGNGTVYNTGRTAADSRLALDNPIILTHTYTAGDLYDVLKLFGETLSQVFTYGTLTSSGGTAKGYYLSYGSWATFYEILIFNTILDLDTQQTIEGYLAWKYGLNLELPVDHPHYAEWPWYGPRSYTIQFMQPWNLSMGVGFAAEYKDADVLKKQFAAIYSKAVVTKVGLNQLWRSYVIVKTFLDSYWSLSSAVKAALNAPFNIVGAVISRSLEAIYSIKNTDVVSTSLDQRYWSSDYVGGSSLVEQYVTLADSSIVHLTSVSFKSSFDQYAFSVSIDVSTISDLKRLVPGSIVTLHNVLNVNISLVVDEYDYDESASSDSYKIELLSSTALLDSPFCSLVTAELVGLASEICADLAGAVPVIWQARDWYIGEGVLSVTDDTPINIIRNIANAIGAKLQSTANGSLIVVSRYPKSCDVWSSQVPAASINYARDVISEHRTSIKGTGYNSYNIQDNTTADSILRIDVEDVDTYTKTLKVFVYPDTVPTVRHSGDPAAVNMAYLGYKTGTVESEVEIVSGEGSVDGPILSSVSVVWNHTDLGVVTFEPTGVVYASVKSDSLLEFSYTTGWYEYTITSSTLENLQVIVEADV